MKNIKHIAITCLILVTMVFFAREWIYNRAVTYRSIGLRTNYEATNPLLIKFLDSATGKRTQPGLEEIIDLSLEITSNQLNFTVENTSNDPNLLISTGRAHCVGYASFFANTCNYLLKKYGLDRQWIAKPQIGQLYVFHTNIHKYLYSPFLKDHDFVTIENKITGESLAVDPTVNDYLGINLVKFME